MLHLNSEHTQINWLPKKYFNFRIILVMALFVIVISPTEIGKITFDALEDAYLGVAVFVAITLLLF